MIKVKMNPKEGGRLHLDGRTFDPRIQYSVGSKVKVKIVPVGDFQFTGWTGDVPEGHKADVPLEMTVTDKDQELVANFAIGVEHAQELCFDSDFDNGNGILRYNYRNSRGICVEPEQIKGASNIWWHFKLGGITPDEFLLILPLHSSIEAEAWASDCHPVYSYDGVTWHRFTGERPPYVQRFTEPSVEIARNIPYPYGKSLALASEVKGDCVNVLDLTTSEEGRAVKTFRFTDPGVPDNSKRVIWFTARTHAFESHGSWVAEGFIRWLLGDHPLAAELRRRTLTYITPIMDVDNVYNGGAGKEQLGPDGERTDFGRRWDDDTPWAAVRASKKLLLELDKHHEIAAMLDVHNPWYPIESHFNTNPEDAKEVQAFEDMFIKYVEELGSGARYKSWVQVRGGRPDDVTIKDPSLAAMGGVRNREPTHGMIGRKEWAQKSLSLPEHHLSFGIEISHWYDGYGNFITADTLLVYGAAFGCALANWLAGLDKP